MADRLNHSAVSQFVLVLNAADREGIGIAPALKAQAEQYRTERFYQAESLAMQAPVKMLAPMVLFIFPGTFIVLMFPVLSRLISEGVFK
jgi:tight adherence protein C